MSETEPDYTIGAAVPYQEYIENRDLANDKYLIKILKVIGSIDEINIVLQNDL